MKSNNVAWLLGAVALIAAAVAASNNPKNRRRPELFFPEPGVSSEPAKHICAECPVRVPCLEFSLATESEFGVFGGLSSGERNRLLRGKPERRPRTACRRGHSLTGVNVRIGAGGVGYAGYASGRGKWRGKQVVTPRRLAPQPTAQPSLTSKHR